MRPAGARSSTGLWRPWDGVQGGPGGAWGRHAPLDWNSYCVHELADSTLLFSFVFFTINCCFSIKVCHVLLCMSRNMGQINPAGFQSLKYVYYTYVIMTIKWILTLTLTLNILKYISSSFMGVIRITSFTGNGWWVYRHEPQSVITIANWSTHTCTHTHTHIYIYIYIYIYTAYLVHVNMNVNSRFRLVFQELYFWWGYIRTS